MLLGIRKRQISERHYQMPPATRSEAVGCMKMRCGELSSEKNLRMCVCRFQDIHDLRTEMALGNSGAKTGLMAFRCGLCTRRKKQDCELGFPKV